ncbi:hypothetical protein POM88_017745 [Heracleum sosnowskyi]|uniref:Uncharacterized protein n=1 Tax=Heracleum sosnowskyi TaxID=360622 RepID=A0AAD8MYJ9_9APIA|nr:hypothetical protein POM88_017745 [Heracleum sosnowskyi]
MSIIIKSKLLEKSLLLRILNVIFNEFDFHRTLQLRAAQNNGGPRRLVDIIRIVPEISRNYFKSPSRRALFGVVCVLLTEYATRFYYSRPKVTFPVALLNNFKMGFTYGLFIDAFKLAS